VLVAILTPVLMVSWLTGAARAIDASGVDTPWVGVDDSGVEVIELYFVFSSTCPHCHAAIPWVEAWSEEREWLRVWWLQADGGDPMVAEIAQAVAGEIGEPIRGVPTFMYCGTMRTGWDDADGMGAIVIGELDACHDSMIAPESAGPTTTTTTTVASVAVPVVGDVEADAVPLPVFTAIVAGLDAFNPCAFFVLLFLLSLLVHARSRARMAAVGMTFVVVSGVLYFVFMAAWLNLFLVTDNLRAVTLIAGLIAVVLGALSAKDYFRPDLGPSASIPDAAKPGLFARMRGLLSIDRLLPVMAATIALAVVANSYELLCTAGLPMVFTRVLTLNDLPTTSYYGYLALYNVIYVIPLMAIVMGFVWTLGSRKLQPTEGRTLKLLSGSMMLGLGLVLVLAPQLLERVGTAIMVIAAALAVTAGVVVIDRRVHGPSRTV
jgi:hypothetical protein